jgi:transcriptional regulator with XRE-family HTH domain
MLDLLSVVKRLKEAREAKNLSLESVAAQLHLDVAAIQTLEGEQALSRPLLDLYRYADSLGVQLHLALVSPAGS